MGEDGDKQRYYTQPPKTPAPTLSPSAAAEKEINDESARAKAAGQRPDYSKGLDDYMNARDAAKKDPATPQYKRGGKIRASGRAKLHRGEKIRGGKR